MPLQTIFYEARPKRGFQYCFIAWRAVPSNGPARPWDETLSNLAKVKSAFRLNQFPNST